MPENAVRWFEIYVQDMPRAKRFYETVLDVTLQKLEAPDGLEMWAFDMSEHGTGAGGALVHMPGVPSAPGGTLVYFGCADCSAEIARVEAAGGKVQRSKMSIGQYGHIAMAIDTEGNMIGLHSMT